MAKVSEKTTEKGRFELNFEEGAKFGLVIMEVWSKTEGVAFAKAQICKGKYCIWGPEQELVLTLPPASFCALRWEDLLPWNCV